MYIVSPGLDPGLDPICTFQRLKEVVFTITLVLAFIHIPVISVVLLFIDAFSPIQQIFSHLGTICYLPGLNQY